MSVDTTKYEQYLPPDQQYDNKLPAVLDKLEQMYDYNIGEDGQPYSLDFEASENFKRIYLMGRVLARRSIHSDPVIVDNRDLNNSYYTGLMYSLSAIRLIQNSPVDRVSLRSVTLAKGGVEGALQEYESTRPNISDYARTGAEMIAEKENMIVAVGDAALLGFLLYERADGKNKLIQDLNSIVDDI